MTTLVQVIIGQYLFLCVLSKVIERIVVSQLDEYLKLFNYIMNSTQVLSTHIELKHVY